MTTTELAAAVRCLSNAQIGMQEAAALTTIASIKDATYEAMSEALEAPRQTVKVRAQVLKRKGLTTTVFRSDGVPITKLTDKGRQLIAQATADR